MITAKIDHIKYLKAVGGSDDPLANIGYTTLVLASLDRPGVSFQKYEHHLKILGLDLMGELIRSDSAYDRAQALTAVLHGRHEYTGNEEYYEDLQNANLMSVIDTRKGLPVALSILYMHTARTQGWQIEGLSFPGHFLIRLYGADRTGGDPVIIDPFHDGKILDARDLRNMIHEFTGDEAKLFPGYYEAVTDREILVRLLNNIKIRCLQVSDLGQAIEILTRLVMIDPAFMQHHYELGMLLAYVGKNGPARERLLYCLDQLNKLERNDLITQQIINTLKNMDEVDLEKQGSNIVKLPKID